MLDLSVPVKCCCSITSHDDTCFESQRHPAEGKFRFIYLLTIVLLDEVVITTQNVQYHEQYKS